MSVADPAAGRPGLPECRVTVNQLVAYNLAAFRKAAGLGQQELGGPLRWSVASVSAAERSWDGKRVKKFDADEIMLIAAVLGVPLAALFLPPEDHGTAVRYVLDLAEDQARDLADVLPLAFPDFEGDSAAMDAYRKRVIAAGVSGSLHGGGNTEAARMALELAQRAADDAIWRARNDAEQTRGSARTEAMAILADARSVWDQVNDLERDTQERRREALGSLEQDRAQLERRIGELRAFEREYRSKLQAMLEGQFRELWAGEIGIQTDEAIGQLRRRAALHPGQRASGVLLREDGTYEVVQVEPVGGHPRRIPEEPHPPPAIYDSPSPGARAEKGHPQPPDTGGT